MAIIPLRTVLAVVAGAVMPLLLVSGCTSGTSPAASVSAGPTRSVPDDFCERVDYALARPAFGKAMPIPAEDSNRGPGFNCIKSFFGGDGLAGGFVMAKVQTFDNAVKARTGFDSMPGIGTAEPFDGSEQVVADEVRYLQIRGDARVTVLDANVILEVRLASPTPVGDDQAAAFPPAAVRVTNHALDLVRAA